MLINFSITNFKSIKEKITFSMEPVGKVKEHPGHIAKREGKKLLKSAIIYGRNGAGKSNLIEALGALKGITQFVGGIENGDKVKKIPQYIPFKLDGKTVNQPVIFEINFMASNGMEYNYYIEFTADKIIKEVVRQKKLLNPLFEREGDMIIGKRKEYDEQLGVIEKGLFINQTVISKLATEKIEELLPVFSFFSGTLVGLDFNHSSFSDVAIVGIIHMLKLPGFSEISKKLNQLICLADLAIERFEIVPKSSTDKIYKSQKIWETYNKEAAESGLNYKIIFIHKDNKGKEVKFEFEEESSGTQKFFHIAFWIIAQFEAKGVLYLDEMDQSLHPELTKLLIEIIQDSKLNPNSAQLIFASHDVTQLSSMLFRRDEIWFAEKDDLSATTYYTLSDIKGVRPSVNYEKYYLKGAFGASPVINKKDLDW